MAISLPFSLMEEIDLLKREVTLRLKTGLCFRVRPSLGETEQFYQLLLKGYMAIPFFPKYVFEQDECLSYDCLAEMQRIRMNWSHLIIVKNASGELCSTYPKYFVIAFLAR